MTQFFRKIYRSLYWKGCVWEEVGDWTELQHIDPHSIGHNCVSFPFSWAAQPGAWGPSLSGTCSSIRHLTSNWLNFLCTELYNSSTPTFFLWASHIALIQPIHGQGYNILIFLDQMHLLFTQVHFLFWQPGRVGGQYTAVSHYLLLIIVKVNLCFQFWNFVLYRVTFYYFAQSAGAVEYTDCCSAEG